MLSLSAVLAAALATSASLPLHPVAKPRVVTIKTTEFAFTAPASLPAGTTTLHFVNAGKELHHVVVIKLENGKTLADFMDAVKKPGPPPAWAVFLGGPNAPVPGKSFDATMTLDAGNYILACFVPSPGEQMPHLMKGMVKPLTVTPSAGSAAAEPTADVDLVLSDYKFTRTGALTAGHHVLRVTNSATQLHELLLVKLAPGKTAPDVASWIESGMKGEPPAMPLGGVAPMAPGRTIYVPMDLEAGQYGLICLLPDAKDGKLHTSHGMAETFTVR